MRAAPALIQRLDALPPIGAADWAYAGQLRGMVDGAFCSSERYKDQQRRPDRTRAHPQILEFERKLIKRAFKLGVPLFPHCIVRTAEDQDAAYVLGNSKAKAGESPHNYGCAVDIVHGVKAWNLTKKQWEIIGHLGEEIAAQAGISIAWGGDWNFYDPAHWELTEWRDYRASYASAA